MLAQDKTKTKRKFQTHHHKSSLSHTLIQRIRPFWLHQLRARTTTGPTSQHTIQQTRPKTQNRVSALTERKKIFCLINVRSLTSSHCWLRCEKVTFHKVRLKSSPRCNFSPILWSIQVPSPSPSLQSKSEVQVVRKTLGL